MVDNTLPSSIAEKLLAAVKPERLLKTATALVEVPSPTRSAGAAADRLAAILGEDGFRVERPEADWAESPAVVTRLDSGRPGRTLQFDGHLDTVHLPFAPPRFEQGVLHGSGASDMKGGIAAFVEALRVLQETGALSGGGILLTAHDHHEGPWGDGRQLRALIDAGYTGDGVLLPEYLGDRLALAGRGSGIFEITISREEPPVHEVLRPEGLPEVLGTGVELAARFARWQQELEQQRDPYAGHDSVFVGKFQSGEIYNQSPRECRLNGTRRWVTPGAGKQVEADFRQRLQDLARESRTRISTDYHFMAEAFRIDAAEPLALALQSAHTAATGKPLPLGGKPFVDDGNVFCNRAGIPALTHGPLAQGAHTTRETVSLDELVRVARVYALTAVAYC